MADHLLRAMGLERRVRVVAAVTTATVEELRRIHDLSATASAALGRTATGAVLLAALLEKVTLREPVLTISIDGGGPVGQLVATASPVGWVRAMAANPRAEGSVRPDGKLDVGGIVGTAGELAVTRDPGYGEPYRGVVPLVNGEIATDLAHYLSSSEQHPAAVVLGVHLLPEGRVDQAGGYLIQVLPGVSDAEADALSDRVRSIGAVTEQLLHGGGPEAWLEQLFPAGFELFGETPVRFHCGCSRERVETALKLLGREELGRIAVEARDGLPAELVCEFCRTAWTIPTPRLEELLVELETELGGVTN